MLLKKEKKITALKYVKMYSFFCCCNFTALKAERSDNLFKTKETTAALNSIKSIFFKIKNNTKGVIPQASNYNKSSDNDVF